MLERQFGILMMVRVQLGNVFEPAATSNFDSGNAKLAKRIDRSCVNVGDHTVDRQLLYQLRQKNLGRRFLMQ